MKYILRALPVIAAVAALSPNAAGATHSANCGFVGFAPHSDNGAFRIVARMTTCQTARSVADASRPSRFRYGNPRYAASGFSCSGRSEKLGGNGKHVVRFDCVRARRSVSFLRG